MIKDNTVIVHFPLMLEDLLPESFGPLALFLNPGTHDSAEKFYRPEKLVLDPGGVRTFLSQSVQFGEQFKKPSDMAYLGARKSEDFYSDTSLSLRWQISTYGREDNAQDADLEYLRAQQLLLLEYTFEERMADLRSLSAGLGASWKELDSSLGIDREHEEFEALDRIIDLGINTSANWQKLLWAFALFVPDDAFLLLEERTIARELEEAGVSWEKAPYENYWHEFPSGHEVYKGVLETGNKQAYPGRISRDINFLTVNK